MDIATTTTISRDVFEGSAIAVPDDNKSQTSQLSSDFEVFLKMLTAQMQYQDPLNPVDSTDYATQLATFSGVEQAVLTNDLLGDLTAQMAVGGLTDLAPWVGREARTDADVSFDGAPIELFPKPLPLADRTEILVRNAQGEEVQRIPITTETDKVSWSGILPNGIQLPEGTYRFTAIGVSNGEVLGETPVETYSRVTEVRIADGKPAVVLEGGVVVSSTDVTALRDGTA